MVITTGTRFGHYEVTAPLGKGGMGEVCLAEDTRLKRKVALKLLPTEFTFNAERLRRFELEAKAASGLNHPNIITIYDIGEAHNTHFIATEYIEGETLRERLRRKKLTLNEALDIALQIADALAAAHQAGIIHRDIKPENVMIRNDGIVKVLDFGLAKLTERKGEGEKARLGEDDATLALSPAPSHATDPGAVMGTPQYMSPEQARGQQVDARTDIFSFGTVLYEMLAGRPPFEGVNVVDVMAAILDREPPSLKSFLPDLPPTVAHELEHGVTKALRKDREQRWQHIKDLLVDLKECREELVVAARQARAVQAQTTETIPTPEASAPTNEIAAINTQSSGKIILGEIKRHKLGVGVALTIIIVAVMGIGLYLHAQKTEVAIDSIAILPFANQNRDPEAEYLADGLTESIINNLTQLPALRVIARNSAFRFKGKEDDPLSAGQTLGVRAVVVGRVLQRGENLMVSAELVDVRENKQLWGQQYNRKLADVFAVQEEIAKAISEKLRLKLTSAEQQQLAKRPTENLKAFQYYMQGRSYINRPTREDLLEAIRYCEKAIEEDRNYALAYAGLSEAYAYLGARGYLAPSEGRRKAEEAARKALALDDNLAEAHAAVGLADVSFTPSNFSLADRELRRAIELSPSLAVARFDLGISLARQGRLDEALDELLKGRKLDPLAPVIARAMALPYYLKRDYGRAIELLRQANELGPAFSTTFEIGVYIQSKLLNKTLVELEQAKQRRPNDVILICSTGLIYAAQGKRAESLQVIKELEAMSGTSLSQAHWIAKIYAALNEKGLALTWLERGLTAGAIGVFYKDDPVWDAIRSDPRFSDLLRRMGVPQ